MSQRVVIPECRESHGDGTAFNFNLVSLLRARPNSETPRRHGIFLCILLATVSGAVFMPTAAAKTSVTVTTPEGFSVSSEGLPEKVMDAWYATVRVEGRGVSWPPGKCPRQRMRRGSGIVVKLTEKGRMAVVATNSHIVSCAYGTCELRVGFGDSSSPCSPKWSNAVQVVSRNPQKDLAILEVEIPAGAEVRAARFASPECHEAGVESVYSIGWPDLKERKVWGVRPPPNFRAQIRRHSRGTLLLCLRNFQLRSEAGEVLDRLPVIFHNSDVLPGSSGGPLTNGKGEVLGVNTMIEGRTTPSDKHEFCAALNSQDAGRCVHVAISSREVIREYGQIYSSPVSLTDCGRPFDSWENRREARGTGNSTP